ncbi:MAG: Beta-lactamase hydrolase-family protein [Gammaproteobacteria bacterium]|nr:Beta-lactamase hydrolase-family protein [Gammaproteobacteria bacterium]
MMRVIKILTSLLGMVSMSGEAIAQEQELAINFVAVSDRLHTAGQPDEAHLSSLASRGYGLVINIAPPASRGSIATEGKLVAETGIAYVNIPVDWQNPQYADFELFSGIMQQAGTRRVLVHCQMNMRASLFTFLYRVVHEQVDPKEAYRFVSKVWEPKDQWLAFARLVLNKNNIQFEFSKK